MTVLAVFEKNGTQRNAYTRADVVRLEFDGWTRVTGAGDEPPPQSGKGSGRDSWAAYAQAHGIAVTDEMSRDEIIAAAAAVGLVTVDTPDTQ